ncbi:MAG TPA: hypothetical protein VEA16_02600 [Vicinamibacterales bacterium]|nr:hypothetical protein [Vicinamibacterales bacterium]
MKKILAGCLIVVVIALIGFGVAGYYAYRLAQPMLENAGDVLARAREMAAIGDRIANKAPYVPPKNGELTQSQVERFLAVQTRVRSELDSRWDEIETRSAEIRKKTEGDEPLALSEVTAIFSDLATIYLDARRAQVTALNTQKFSDAEYNWVRRRVWEAAGIELAAGLDMSAIENLARQGTQRPDLELPDMPMPEVPEQNIRLVKPHTAKLKEWIPIAVLGL